MVRTLARSIREYKKASILAPIFVTFEAILEIIIPYLMGYVIDYGINAAKGYTWCDSLGELLPLILSNQKAVVPDGAVITGNMTIVWQLSLVLVALAVISLICGVLSGRFAAVAGTGFSKNLRHDMYYKLQNFAFANIDKLSTPSIITRITTDVTNIQNSYQMVIRIAVRAPVMLALSFVMSVRIKWQLSLIFLCAVPLLGVAAFLLLSSAHPIFERVFKKYDNLNNVVEENIRGIRVVKSFVREDHERTKFKTASFDIYQDFVKAEKLMALAFPGISVIIYACMLLLDWFSAQYIYAGSLQTGDFVSMVSYTMQIMMSLIMVAMVFLMIVISKASMERVCELLEEQPTITDPQNPVTAVKDGSISFENVSFSYSGEGGNLCLKDVNLQINSGETIGIIGGTGSSKTTFVQLIPRLYDVTSGCVKVGGVDVKNYDLNVLRDKVSMVLQKNLLFAGSIKDNLRWGDQNATDEELVAACKTAQADGFIRSFEGGYDYRIDQGGANVSGGQKQRLCIARALLKKPAILILDDSTSAVDTKTDAEIRKAFRTAIDGTTRIIIAQRITSVMDADKIIVLDGGAVNGIGTHQELMENNAIYREVYDSQQKTGGDFDEEAPAAEDGGVPEQEGKEGNDND